MLQLILHAIGDYLVQNDWMALNKKKPGFKGNIACLVHVFSYGLPFLFIGSTPAVMWIIFTHYLIDRYHIVESFLAFRNNVKDSFGKYDTSNFGFSPDRPTFISVWLYIFVDNIFHIICNYLSLHFL